MNKQEIAEKTARQIKEHLIDLATKDKMPVDLNNLYTGKIITIIKNNISKAEKEAKKDVILNRAGCYLSGDESEIERMVKLIAQHVDNRPNLLIDMIDDVDVYEKCEFQFSCKEFLSAIGFDKKVF